MATVTSGVLPKHFVITLRHYGPYENVNETWATLSEFAREHKLIGSATQAIGIVYDDPTQTPATMLRYDACLTITQQQSEILQGQNPVNTVFDPRQPPELSGRSLTAIEGVAIRIETIPGGPTLVITHKGSHRNLREAYTTLLYSTADSANPLSRTPPPYFEVYKNNPRFTPPEALLTEIHVPVKSPAGG